MCALELGCWCRCRVLLRDVDGRVCFGAWMLVPLQGAAAGCCCCRLYTASTCSWQSLRNANAELPLQVASARCVWLCAPWSFGAVAAAPCGCNVHTHGALEMVNFKKVFLGRRRQDRQNIWNATFPEVTRDAEVL